MLMKALTKSDLSLWCDEHGLEVVDREWPPYSGEGWFTFLVKLPRSCSRTLALPRTSLPFDENRSFSGAMVWFRDWGIGNDTDEETAMHLIQRLRGRAGEERPLIEAPGHLFSAEEFSDVRAYWTVSMIFGWDPFLFPLGSDYFVFNSRDEVVSFVAKSSLAHDALLSKFKDWNIAKSNWYFD
jgi:hypothetical protein